MAEDLSRQIHDLLECSVCLQQLDSNSKVLPCQHTFCRKCLLEIYSFHKELRCPECRVLVSCRIDDLPSNILLLRLLEGLKGLQKLDGYQEAQEVSTSSSNVTDLSVSSKVNGERGGVVGVKTETGQLVHALSLVDQRGKNNQELSLKFGENITILSRENERYYRAAKSNGEIGIVSVSTVRILSPPTTVAPPVPVTKEIPLGKTLYAFQLSVPSSSNCLKFDKGLNIEVLRRVNEQWGEGKLNGKVGLFPLSFVELNAAGAALINSRKTTAFTKSGEVISSLIVPNGQTNGQQKRRSMGAPLPLSGLNSPVTPTQPKYEIPSAGLKPKVPSKPIAAPLPVNNPHSNHVVAVYNYKGQQADELDVKKGDVFVVTDRCKDGWFKGYKLNTDRHGVVPGNYFRPLGDSKVSGNPGGNQRKASIDSNISTSRSESATNGPQRPQRLKSDSQAHSARSTSFVQPRLPLFSPSSNHSASSRSPSPSSASPSSSSSSSSNRSSADLSDNQFAALPESPSTGAARPTLPAVSLPTSVSQSFTAASKNAAKNAGNLVRHMFAFGINKGSTRAQGMSKSADGSPALVTDMFEIRTGLRSEPGSGQPGPSATANPFEINPNPIGPPIRINPVALQASCRSDPPSQDAKKVGQILEVKLRNPIPLSKRVENQYSTRDNNTGAAAEASSSGAALGKAFIRNKLRHSLAPDTVSAAQRPEQPRGGIKMGLRSVGVGQTRKDRARSLIMSDSNLINLGNSDVPSGSNALMVEPVSLPDSPSKNKRSNRHSFLGGWKMGKAKKHPHVHENMCFDSFEGTTEVPGGSPRPQLPSPLEPTVSSPRNPTDNNVKMRRKPDQQPPERYRVVVGYPPSSSNELALEVGEIILVTRKRSDGWFKGTLVSGSCGWFPGVFVEKI